MITGELLAACLVALEMFTQDQGQDEEKDGETFASIVTNESGKPTEFWHRGKYWTHSTSKSVAL